MYVKVLIHTLKFEQTVSSTTIPFLDVQVILDNDKIKTDLYTKPTDTQLD